jgi:hypothetical protein
VRKAVFAMTVLAAGIALASPAASAASLNLNQEQSAIYLACIAVAGAGNLSPQITPNTLAAQILLNQQVVSQMQSLPALQGMTFIQLGQLVPKSLKDYAKTQLGCTSKCTTVALNLFLTQSQSSCLSIASGFTP